MLFGHTCNHPNGKSHLCGCVLKESHGSFQTKCELHGGNSVRDQEVNGRFVNEVHNFLTPAEGTGCSACGEQKEHRLHPHAYKEAPDFRRVCRCGSSSRALIHQMSSI